MAADFYNTLERNGMLAIGLLLANKSGLRSGFSILDEPAVFLMRSERSHLKTIVSQFR